MSFTIGSLFDGSGGFPLAATMCGGIPKWSSEIEPYPIAVTKSRFPGIKHLGSVTDIKGGEVEPVDVITFGSPCQDLSVAGKRAGLKHTDNGDDETTRSGLFMEAVRIIKEMREATNGVYPRFALWENVPGAFSSNKGEDFRIVLEELIKIVEPTAVMPAVPKNGWPYADSYCGDGWSIAYRVLDAQFWGVPQRRRRIYLVADFRGERANQVSFEREGLRGYFAESGTTWQAAPGDAEAGSGAADCERNAIGFLRQLSGVEASEEVSPTLMAAAGMSGNNKPCVAYAIDKAITTGGNCTAGGSCVHDEITPTLTTDRPHAVAYAIDQQGGKGGANFAENVMPTLCSDSHGTPHAVAYGISSFASNAMKSDNPHSGIYEASTSRTLDLNGGNPACNQGGIAIVEQVSYGVTTKGNGDAFISEERHTALTAGGGQAGQGYPCVMEPVPYTLKIRSGCDVDANGKSGGKGALVQTNLSATLATSNDQYLFQPIGFDAYNQAVTGNVTKSLTAIKSDADHVPVVCMATQQGGAEIMEDKCPTITASAGMSGNNQPVVALIDSVGGQAERGWVGETAPCLKATHYKFAPCVAMPAVTLEPGIAAREGGHIYEGVSGTLRANAGDNQMAGAYSIENHPADSRVNIDDSGKVQTLTSRMGTGGGNVPMVMESMLASGKNATGCLMASGYEKLGAQEMFSGDYTVIEKHPTVCIEGNGSRPSHRGDGYAESDVMYTLNATEQHGVSYCTDIGFWSSQKECSPTLLARQYKDPHLVSYCENTQYIVRRLTPTECARLQGFPDTWGHPIEKTEFTDEEYQFWLNVRNTHAAINEKTVKDYTKEQMLKWYNGLHTDSSEYKMWGNGIALPNALYMMQGISDVMVEEKAARRKWLDNLLK